MVSKALYEKDNFLNKNIMFLFNKDIIEYDMKDAGFSLTKEFKLLDDKTIEKLGKMKKETRKIELGKIKIKNKKYVEDEKEAFRRVRQYFFEINKLDDNDVLSVKKDAIFTMKRCDVTNFGKYIEFRPKNEYSSYIYLPPYEMYYNYQTLDIKGMNKDNMELHKDYMIKFIKLFIHKMETDDPANVISFVRRFADKYKRRELEVGYYRSFDYESCFHVLDEDLGTFGDYWEDRKDDLDIHFNFMKIIIKLLQIPL